MQDNSFEISPGEDFSTNPLPVQLAPLKIAVGLFLFEGRETKKAVVFSLKAIYRDRVLEILSKEGFAKIYRSNNQYFFVRSDQRRLTQITIPQIRDFLLDFVKDKYGGDGISLNDNGITLQASSDLIKEVWLRQQHLITNDAFLSNLPNISLGEILRDKRDRAFLLFKNCVVQVTAEGHTTLSYAELNGYVWADHIVDRNFEYTANWLDCHYAKFHSNVCENDPARITSMQTATGFLIHHYAHPASNRIIIAYDQMITDLDTPEGGTGKGVFLQAVAQVRKTVFIDGKKFDTRDRFVFQQIDEVSQVVGFDDLRKQKGVLDRLNSAVSEGLVVEHKNQKSFHIEPEQMPKLYVSSNAILDMEGNTRKRRQHIIEFAPYYSDLNKKGIGEPILHCHGGRFFDKEDWDLGEWNRFNSYLIYCVEVFLKKGLLPAGLVGVKHNRLIQTTCEEFAKWITDGSYYFNTWYETKPRFTEFKATFFGDDSELKQRTFTGWLKRYAVIENCSLEVKRSAGSQWFMIKSEKLQAVEQNIDLEFENELV